MATIGTVVSTETKAEFESAARLRGTTTSRLAASLINSFLKDEACKIAPTVHPGRQGMPPGVSGYIGTKTEQVHVRLEPYYFAELGRLAEERDWYRGTYLGNLFRAHLDRRPVLCEVEINAVRQVARQLADMGRNINQIARKLNISLEHAHLIASMDFELLKMLIEFESNAIRSLMKANVRGWGISDAEA